MSSTVPPIAATYDSLWGRFLVAHAAAKAAALALAGEEKAATKREYGLVFDWNPTDRSDDSIEHIASQVISALVNEAERILPPAGATLSIDTSAIKEAWIIGDRYDRKLREDFTPLAVWEHLAKQYGGQRAADAAFEQAAEHIVKDFHLHQLPEIKQVSGAVELELRVYTERRFSGEREISWGWREDLNKLMRALQGFLAWTGEDELSETYFGLGRMQRAISNGTVTSRMRVGGGDMFFIFYHEKIIARIAPAKAEKLNEFVCQYSKRMRTALEEAAAEQQAKAA